MEHTNSESIHYRVVKIYVLPQSNQRSVGNFDSFEMEPATRYRQHRVSVAVCTTESHGHPPRVWRRCLYAKLFAEIDWVNNEFNYEKTEVDAKYGDRFVDETK